MSVTGADLGDEPSTRLSGDQKRAVEAQYRLFVRNSLAASAAGILLALVVANVLTLGAPLISSTAPQKLVLYPLFVMFFLVAGVLTLMGVKRVTAVRSGEIDIRFYRTYDEGAEPETLRVITRHFINLFEMPVLFYVAVLIAHVSAEVTYWIVGLACAYVALRCLHSYVHLSENDVALRLAAYGASGTVLLVLWVTLLIQLLSS